MPAGQKNGKMLVWPEGVRVGEGSGPKSREQGSEITVTGIGFHFRETEKPVGDFEQRAQMQWVRSSCYVEAK